MASSDLLSVFVERWNAQADQYNQWDTLDSDERCEWCIFQMRIDHSRYIRTALWGCKDLSNTIEFKNRWEEK